MEIDKKDYIVKGSPDAETKEKMRLKLRQLLNKYKKCSFGIIGIKSVPKIAFEYSKEGFNHFFFIYKSSSLKKVTFFENIFKEIYRNEITVKEHELDEENKPYLLYLAGKKKKKIF